jgi:hypothetical protein
VKPTRGIGQVLETYIKKTKTILKQTFSHDHWPITRTGTLATRCGPFDVIPVAHFTTNAKSHPDTTKIKATHDELNKAKIYRQSAPLMNAECRPKEIGTTSFHNRKVQNESASPNYDHQVLRHKSGQSLKQHEEYAQRQKPRANKNQAETVTAPRQPIEYKLSRHKEMEEFRAGMNNSMSSMRRKRDRAGYEDTASGN